MFQVAGIDTAVIEKASGNGKSATVIYLANKQPTT